MSICGSASLGQLLMMAVEGREWSVSLERRLRTVRPAGVLLSSGILQTPESTCALLHRIARTIEIPPFLGLDDGKQGALLPPFFAPLPQPPAAAKKGFAAVEKLCELVGSGLSLMGFNLARAPVLDLLPPHGPSSFCRLAFGSDPREVAKCGGAFVRGLSRHKVLACPRHFPGSASLRADPHYRLPVSSKPMADLWREDLVPFREVLPQVPMVEVSAGGYKAYDFDLPRPAMLSRSVVEGLLRVKLGYTGVGVADVRGLKGERDENVAVEGAIRSLQAGCDLVIVSSLGNEFERALDGLELNVKSGKIPANRVQQALNRIQQCKKGLALPTGEMRKRDLEKLVRKCYEFNRETQ